MADESEPCLPRRKRGEVRSKLGKVIAVDIAEAVQDVHALDTFRTSESAIPATISLAPKSNLPEEAAKLECSSSKRGLLLSTLEEELEAPRDDTTLPNYHLLDTVRVSEVEGLGGSSGDLSQSAATELSSLLSRSAATELSSLLSRATSTELSPLLERSARNRKIGRRLLVMVAIFYLIGLGALSWTCCWVFLVGFFTVIAMSVILPILIVRFYF